MLNNIRKTFATAVLWLAYGNAFAAVAPPPPTPEIDGSGTIIALSLVCGLVALIREHKRRK